MDNFTGTSQVGGTLGAKIGGKTGLQFTRRGYIVLKKPPNIRLNIKRKVFPLLASALAVAAAVLGTTLLKGNPVKPLPQPAATSNQAQNPSPDAGPVLERRVELAPEAQAEPPKPEPVYAVHQVQAGESVWAIAQAHGLSQVSVSASNRLNDDAVLQPGQQLLVPAQEGLLYKVISGDTADGLATRFGLTVDSVVQANPGLNPDVLVPGQVLLLPGAKAAERAARDRVRVASAGSGVPARSSRTTVASRGSGRASVEAFPFWPINGKVTSGFGWRRHPVYGTRSFHAGLDISAPKGTPIKAVREGKVILAGWQGDYGLTVEVQHRDGMVTRYSHNSKNLVSVGDTVAVGGSIALVGSTGVATGPHVDFGVLIDGSPVDPTPWLP